MCGYRRWISGRGPLRRVRCSFEQTESCSAFGLRVSRQAPSTSVAVRLIQARLRACGDAALHVETAERESRLTWGTLYDRLDDPGTRELLGWELPATQRALNRAAELSQEAGVARLAAPALAQRLGSPRILLRAGSGELGRLRRLRVTVGIWSAWLIVLALLSSVAAWLWLVWSVAMLFGLRASWRAWRRLDGWRERRQELQAAADFELFQLD